MPRRCMIIITSLTNMSLTSTVMITTITTMALAIMTTTTVMITTVMIMAIEGSDKGLMLGLWLSSAYPTGSFAYSHGIEAAMSDGLVPDFAAVEGWIEDILLHGSGRNDAILFCEAWRCLDMDDGETDLAAVMDLARALTGSRPRFLESCQQGSAFLTITRKAWPHPALERWSTHAGDLAGDDVPFCVAFAMAAKAHAVPPIMALSAYLTGFAAALVAAALRLALLGQTNAQIATARLASRCQTLAQESQGLTLDDLGSSAFHVDIAALRQESVPSRLFRS
jgi:urease accessory protein